MSFRRVLAITFILALAGSMLMVAGIVGGRDWQVQLGFEGLVLSALWLAFHLARRLAAADLPGRQPASSFPTC